MLRSLLEDPVQLTQDFEHVSAFALRSVKTQAQWRMVDERFEDWLVALGDFRNRLIREATW